MKTIMNAGLLFAATVILLLTPQAAPGDELKLVIGSKGFTEQKILGHIMIAILEKNGFQCVDKTGLGGTSVLREALLKRQIDICMEYTGTALSVHLNIGESVTDPQQCYDRVKKEDLERHNLVWLPPLTFNNTYCLMMRRTESEKLGIETLSDLSKYAYRHPAEFTFGLNAEFFTRVDGYPSLQHAYKLKFSRDSIIKMSIGLLYKALGEDLLQVALGYATDGRIKAYDLLPLEDDKHFFPPYNPAPVLHRDVVEKYPQLEEIFKRLVEKLDTDAMVELNYKVDIEGIPARDVARRWLRRVGLL